MMTPTLPQVINTKSGAFIVTEYAPPARPLLPAVVQPPVRTPGSRQQQGARTLTTSRLHHRTTTVPYIRLSGEWLRTAGIEPGTRITVTVTPQGITITTGEIHHDRRPLAPTV